MLRRRSCHGSGSQRACRTSGARATQVHRTLLCSILDRRVHESGIMVSSNAGFPFWPHRRNGFSTLFGVQHTSSSKLLCAHTLILAVAESHEHLTAYRPCTYGIVIDISRSFTSPLSFPKVAYAATCIIALCDILRSFHLLLDG